MKLFDAPAHGSIGMKTGGALKIYAKSLRYLRLHQWRVCSLLCRAGASVGEWESLLFSPFSIRSFALLRSSAAPKRTSLIFSVMKCVLVAATNSFGKV